MRSGFAATLGLAAFLNTTPAAAQPIPLTPSFETAPLVELMDEQCPLLFTDASAVPEYRYTQQRRDFDIVKDTHTPAVLVEVFHMRHTPSREYFTSACGSWQTMRALAQGVVAYKQEHHPLLDLVFIDEGHGVDHPGFFDEEKNIKEYEFTQRAAAQLSSILNYEGIKAVVVSQDDFVPVPYSRIEHRRNIVNHINARARGRDAITLSVHADNVPVYDERPLPTRLFTARSSSRASRLLAESLDAHARVHYCTILSSACITAPR